MNNRVLVETMQRYDYYHKGEYDTHNSPMAFLWMPEEQQAELLDLIQMYLQPIKTINEKLDSYGLKHLFEKLTSWGYLGNGELKGAMISCGYLVKESPRGINHMYNVSDKSVKHLREVVNAAAQK